MSSIKSILRLYLFGVICLSTSLFAAGEQGTDGENCNVIAAFAGNSEHARGQLARAEGSRMVQELMVSLNSSAETGGVSLATALQQKLSELTDIAQFNPSPQEAALLQGSLASIVTAQKGAGELKKAMKKMMEIIDPEAVEIPPNPVVGQNWLTHKMAQVTGLQTLSNYRHRKAHTGMQTAPVDLLNSLAKTKTTIEDGILDSQGLLDGAEVAMAQAQIRLFAQAESAAQFAADWKVYREQVSDGTPEAIAMDKIIRTALNTEQRLRQQREVVVDNLARGQLIHDTLEEAQDLVAHVVPVEMERLQGSMVHLEVVEASTAAHEFTGKLRELSGQANKVLAERISSGVDKMEDLRNDPKFQKLLDDANTQTDATVRRLEVNQRKHDQELPGAIAKLKDKNANTVRRIASQTSLSLPAAITHQPTASEVQKITQQLAAPAPLGEGSGVVLEAAKPADSRVIESTVVKPADIVIESTAAKPADIVAKKPKSSDE